MSKLNLTNPTDGKPIASQKMWRLPKMDFRGILSDIPEERAAEQRRFNAKGFLPYLCRANNERPKHQRATSRTSRVPAIDKEML